MRRSGGIGAVAALLLAVLVPGSAHAQSPSPSPSPSASASASPSPTATPSPSPSPSASPTPSPTPTPDPGTADLAVAFDPGRTLAQIGERFTYRLTITNTGSTPLTNLEVHQFVPPELNVTGVPILDEVDFTQLGRVGGVDEDILWGINTFPAGASLTLSWFAQVDRPGDYTATGSVDADADGFQRSLTPPPVYIAEAEVLGVVVQGASSVEQTVTRTRQVSGPGVLGAPGAILPATGMTEGGFAVLGLALVAFGTFLWRARGKRAAIQALIATALLLTACTSGGDDIEPEVRGNRIENTTPGDEDPADNEPGDEEPADDEPGEGTDGDEGDDPAIDGADDDPTGETTDTPDVIAGAPNAVPAPVQFVTEEVVVDVPVSELDTTKLGPATSDNAIALDWSSASGIVSARSSLFFDPTAVASLRTTLAASGDQMIVNVTLENLLEDERLIVDGRFLHDVAGLPGGKVTLGSPVDVTLAPGAVTKQQFIYKMPSGTYTLSSRFDPA